MNFYAGADGGGTKTAVLCLSEQGEKLASADFGPFNVNSVGRAGLRAVMTDILSFLQEQGTCLRLCIGAAGNSSTAVREEIAAVMHKAPHIPYESVADFEIARYGALGGRPGLALIAGTGSVCCGVNEAGEKLRVGGWGHLIGDGGSGYAIGRDALRHLTLSRDGMAQGGRLCELLETELSLTDREKITELVYGRDKSSVAAVSACVLRAAEYGDEAAIGILRRNAAELAMSVKTAARSLNMEAPEVALLGGMIRQDNCYRRMVVSEIGEILRGACCVNGKYSPDWGAALMAKAGGERAHG